MERFLTPAEGDDVSANEQLSRADGLANVVSLMSRLPSAPAESSPSSNDDYSSLPDLTVTREIKQQWKNGYNAWVRVPVSIPDGVSVKGVLRAVNSSLAGRMPLTHRSPDRHTFVALFRIGDASPETMRDLGTFAVSMAKVLGPLAVGEPTVQVTHFSEPLSEPLEVHSSI